MRIWLLSLGGTLSWLVLIVQIIIIHVFFLSRPHEVSFRVACRVLQVISSGIR
jgi:hypothetical protein